MVMMLLLLVVVGLGLDRLGLGMVMVVRWISSQGVRRLLPRRLCREDRLWCECGDRMVYAV